MTVYFTSDLHLGHRSVAYDRRYGHWPQDRSEVSVQDVWWHDNLLAERWDDTVGKDDVVWVLGDLALTDSTTLTALDWLNERPGTKHLILGNHDPGHPMHSAYAKWQRRYFAAFESVQTFGRRKIALPDGSRQIVLLSHFPYVGDGDSKAEDRDTQYRLRNEGLALLHGHTHSTDKLTWAPPPGVLEDCGVADDYADRVTQIHVGLDAWDFRPVSLEQVTEILEWDAGT